MSELWESLPFDGYPSILLPQNLAPLNLTLGDAILSRATARSIRPVQLVLAQVATILHHAYGITRDNKGTVFPRPFRSVPSGGGLYPLEIFFHSSHIEGLKPGVYHFNPVQNRLRMLREGDCARELADALVQPQLAMDVSLFFFITAVFERSIFKYGDRGYRFTLLEAGHVAQNMNLVANALGLGCVNVGGYFDREVDVLLNLDGITHSTVYIIGVGQNDPDGHSLKGLH